MRLSAPANFAFQDHSALGYAGNDCIVLQRDPIEIRVNCTAKELLLIPAKLGNSASGHRDSFELTPDWSVSDPGNASDRDPANEILPECMRPRHAFSPASGPRACDAPRWNTRTPRRPHPPKKTKDIPLPVRRHNRKRSDLKWVDVAGSPHR